MAFVGVTMGEGNGGGTIAVGDGNGSGGAICAAQRSRWTAASAMGDIGAMGGRTAGRPLQGREMG